MKELTSDNRFAIRRFINKHGEKTVINILQQSLAQLQIDLFRYTNRKENTAIDNQKRLKEGLKVFEIKYTNSSLEQQLGEVMAYCEFLKLNLGDQFKDSEQLTERAFHRWIDHAETSTKENLEVKNE